MDLLASLATGQASHRRTLKGPPPVDLPCHPTLILQNDPDASMLTHVLVNDLIYAHNSLFRSHVTFGLDDASRLDVTSFLEGRDLLNLTKACGGSILPDSLENLVGGGQKYQAVVVNDTFLFRSEEAAELVRHLYESGCSVVIMARGPEVYCLSQLRQLFNVDWKMVAYHNRYLSLTATGKRIVGPHALEYEKVYTCAHWVLGEQELMEEYQDPDDYYDFEDDEKEEEEMYLPPPVWPGSPVSCKVLDNKSISFFGFRNHADVSYGSMILRLCYAAHAT